MKQSIIILIFLFSVISQAKVIKTSEVHWLPLAAEKNIREFNVCGNSEIQPTKKSLSQHFLLEPQKTGFLFSNLISSQQYYALLSEMKLEKAKSALEIEFNKAHLWRYSKEKGLEDLGIPTKINLSFSSTIKDCIDGAKTTLGSDCSRFQGNSRYSCCKEKFVGPTVFWGDKQEYKHMYSPDPSIRLRVSGDKNHRYCNVQEMVRLK